MTEPVPSLRSLNQAVSWLPLPHSPSCPKQPTYGMETLSWQNTKSKYLKGKSTHKETGCFALTWPWSAANYLPAAPARVRSTRCFETSGSDPPQSVCSVFSLPAFVVHWRISHTPRPAAAGGCTGFRFPMNPEHQPHRACCLRFIRRAGTTPGTRSRTHITT